MKENPKLRDIWYSSSQFTHHYAIVRKLKLHKTA